MEGFFTKKEVESKSRPDGKVYSCASCRLHKDCKSPRIQPFGKFKKGILNIGEAPGEAEDLTGKPWQGRVGKLLKQTYDSLGIDLFEDCLNINAVNCRPISKDGHNRAPTAYEVDCCRRSVLNVIYTHKPRVVVLFGNQAVYSLIGHRWKKDLGGITKWRGWTIPDQDFKTWICPTYHPSFVERADDGRSGKTAEFTIWKQDLEQAVGLIKESIYKGKKYLAHPFPILKTPTIEIISDLSVLNKIKSGEVAFDYETTGIKPHAPGQRIVSCSVATGPDFVYSFLIPETKREVIPLINLLINPNVGKIAQNMKYEHAWSKVKFRIEVQNWVHDTMIMSHIMDNRQMVTGLKFQVYVQFGVVDYASEVSQFLTSTDGKGSNAINNIFKLLTMPGGKKKLLTYGGYDSIYEYRLANQQRANLLPF